MLNGTPGRRLLETYEAERRPIGELTSEQAYTRYVLRLDPELGKDDIQPFVPDPTSSSATLSTLPPSSPRGTTTGPSTRPDEPSGRPGTRAPHVDLEHGSTLDLFGRDFVVLSPSDAWCRAAEGGSLAAHRVEMPEFTEAYGTGAEGAVLVRPDGFIAWRARGPHEDGERELSSALARILDR